MTNLTAVLHQYTNPLSPMKIQCTFACSVMLSLVVSIAFAQDKPDAASTPKTAELLETNTIYQYKTEPVYDPRPTI